jgi:hypothetical protein
MYPDLKDIVTHIVDDRKMVRLFASPKDSFQAIEDHITKMEYLLWKVRTIEIVPEVVR